MCIMVPVSPRTPAETSAWDKASNPHERKFCQLPGIHIEPFLLHSTQMMIPRREYCLSNHIECEDFRDVSIDPEPGKQCQGEVHHGLGLGDHDRLPFEGAKPMPLAAMMALDPIRPGFAHDQLLGWDHCGIDRPMIGTIECHIPLGQ